MFNILITGGSGQLGSELNLLSKEFKEHNFHFTNSKNLDITDAKAIESLVKEKEISCIINCAAYTAVDKAETDKVNADAVNNIAVRSLADISKKYNCKLIHISTDYVFDGKGHKPYSPEDLTDPVNYYGASKLAGEKAMLEINPENSIIIRTSWVYSSFGNNFVKTMLRLGNERDSLNVIYDQVGVPTYARDLAHFILYKGLHFISESVNIYQYTNEGVCSWYDFAKEIMELSNLNCSVSPIPTVAYPTPANRPHYSLMDKQTIKEDFNTQIPYWKTSLKDCLKLLNKK